MRVTLNGEEVTVQEGTSVADVVAHLGSDTSATAVACNEVVVPRSAWTETALRPGDRLEVLSASPGG